MRHTPPDQFETAKPQNLDDNKKENLDKNAIDETPVDVSVQLHQGDCLQVMKTLPDGCVDLSFFSPPYNLSNSTGNGFKSMKNGKLGSGRWKNAKLAHGYDGHSDDMPYADYVEWQKSILREVWRLTSDDGVIFYQHKPRVQAGRLQMPTDLIPDELRDNLRQIVIWNRTSGFNFNASFFLPSHEWVVIIAKKAWRLKSRGASAAKDVWNIRPDVGNEHPAPFPVALPQTAIEATTAKVIFDPFLGSGSTAIAAIREGRDFVGIELSDQYLAAARTRIDDELASLTKKAA